MGTLFSTTTLSYVSLDKGVAGNTDVWMMNDVPFAVLKLKISGQCGDKWTVRGQPFHQNFLGI